MPDTENVFVTVNSNDGKETFYPLGNAKYRVIEAEPGSTYQVVQIHNTRRLLSDNVIVTRLGNDLILDYSDGAKVQLQDFFIVCKVESCKVEVPSETPEQPYLITEESEATALDSGEFVIYAHGDANVLMEMVKDNQAIQEIFELAFADYASTSSVSFDASTSGSLVTGTAGTGVLLPILISAAGAVEAIASGNSNGGIGSLTSTVSGNAVLGPVIESSGLEAHIYDLEGILLGVAVLDDTGSYTIDLDYQGLVIVVLHDTDDDADYLDEATNLELDIDAVLYAISAISSGDNEININVLTTLAARMAGVEISDESNVNVIEAVTEQSVTDTNIGIAKSFGISETDEIVELSPAALINRDGTLNDDVNDLGRILAAISGMDQENGGISQDGSAISTQTTIEQLFRRLANQGQDIELTEDALNMILGGVLRAAQDNPNIEYDIVNTVRNIVSDSNGNTPPTLALNAGVSGDINLEEATQDQGVFILLGSQGERITITITDNDGNEIIKQISATGSVQSVALSESEVRSLVDGDINVRVMTDSSTDAVEYTYRLDAMPPADPTISIASAGTIQGNAEAGSTVQVDTTGDGNFDTTVIADDEGDWTVSASTSFQHNIQIAARAIDSAGNPSDVITAIVDAIAPDAPSIVIASSTQISGTAEPGSTIEIDTDGDRAPDYIEVVSEDGAWSFDLDPQLNDGDVIAATARDASGNLSESSAAIISVVSPPVIVIASASTISGLAAANAIINIDTNGDGTYDAMASANSDGEWTLDGAFDDGVQVSATATINSVVSQVATQIIDAIAPDVPVINIASATTISGTAEAGSTVAIDTTGDGTSDISVLVDDEGYWTISGMFENNVLIGVTAADANNNVSEVAQDTIDGLAPDAPDITTVTATTISGTAEPGTRIRIDTNGDGVFDLEVPDRVAEDGTWSVSGSFVLTNGDQISAVALDDDNNISELDVYEIDVTPPSPPSIEVFTSSIISGTAEVGATIEIDTDEDGVSDYMTVVGADGTWSIELDPELNDGDIIRVTATDNSDNVSAVSQTTIDAVAPNPASIEIASTTQISGTAEVGATIQIDTNNDGTYDQEVEVDDAGNWSLEGSFLHGQQIEVVTKDAAGNLSEPVTHTIDGVDPEAAIIEIFSGAQIGGTAEPGSTVHIDTNGDGDYDQQVEVDDSGNWLLEGVFVHDTIISVQVMDAGGNTSTVTTQSIDAMAPVPPTIAIASAGEISGTAEPNSTLKVDTNNDGEYEYVVAVDDAGNWAIYPSPPLVVSTERNENQISAVAEDDQGNVSEPAQAELISVDAPSIEIASASTISGTSNPGYTIDIDSNGDGNYDLTDVPVDESGNWSVSGTFNDGDSVTVRAKSNGVTSEEAIAVIDAVAPDVPVVNTFTSTEITASAEPGAEVHLDIDNDGVSDQTQLADENGDVTFTIDPALSDGTEISIWAEDSHNNISEKAGLILGEPIITIASETIISGTGTADETLTVRIYDPAGSEVDVFPVTVGSDGTWEINGEEEGGGTFADGHEVRIDGYSTTKIIDAIAPDAPEIEIASGTEISGTAEPGSTINVYVGGADDVSYTAVVSGDGTWAIDLVPELPHDTALAVTATDFNLNESDSSVGTIDSLAPGEPIIEVASGSTLSGTTEPDATVHVDLDGDGNPDLSAIADDQGNWSIIDINPPLTHGSTVGVHAVDINGNIGDTATATVDTEISLELLSLTTASISGTSDPFSVIEIDYESDGVIDITVTADDQGNWTVDVPVGALQNGDEVNITATDPNQNQASISRAVDTLAPSTAQISSYTDSELSGTAEPNTTVEIDTNNDGVVDLTAEVGEDGTWTAELNPPLAEGAEVTVVVRDDAGNAGNPVTVTIGADLNVDAVSRTQISGTAEPNATIQIDIGDDGSIDYETTVSPTGEWSVDFDPALGSGVEVAVSANDNAATAQIFSIAGLPSRPTITSDDSFGDPDFDIEGTADANIDIHVTVRANDDNGEVIEVIYETRTDRLGNWSINLDEPTLGLLPELQDGAELQISVVAENDNGELSPVAEQNIDFILATFEIEPSYSIDENTGTLTITITRSGGLSETQSVDVSSIFGSADESDYSPVDQTVTFAPGETSKTITVNLIDDDVYEGAETFSLELSNPTNNAVLGDAHTSTVTIEDTTDLPTIDVVAQVVNETDGTITITVTRSGSLDRASSVDYQLTDDTALDGVDYATTRGTLEFDAGESSKTFTVSITDNNSYVGNRNFNVVLDNAVDATINSDSVAITILEDEQPTEISIVGDVVVAEDAGVATITLVRTGDLSNVSTVTLSTLPGSAVAGEDFTAISQSVEFAVGQESITIEIPITADNLLESDEQFTIKLADPENADLGNDSATVTILNDDEEAIIDMLDAVTTTEGETLVFAFERSGNTGTEVTVEYTITGNSDDYDGLATGTITFSAGETRATLDISVLSDQLLEGNEELTISLSNPNPASTVINQATSTVTITDLNRPSQFSIADQTVSEDDGTVTFTITREGGTNHASSVTFSTLTSGSADVTDFDAMSQLVEFAPGETSKTISVVINDNDVDDDSRTLDVQLTDVSSGDEIVDDAASATILDNESPEAVFSISGERVSEDGTQITYTVTRSGDTSQAQSVDYAIDESATDASYVELYREMQAYGNAGDNIGGASSPEDVSGFSYYASQANPNFELTSTPVFTDGSYGARITGSTSGKSKYKSFMAAETGTRDQIVSAYIKLSDSHSKHGTLQLNVASTTNSLHLEINSATDKIELRNITSASGSGWPNSTVLHNYNFGALGLDIQQDGEYTILSARSGNTLTVSLTDESTGQTYTSSYSSGTLGGKTGTKAGFGKGENNNSTFFKDIKFHSSSDDADLEGTAEEDFSGRLDFASGETEKTFTIDVVDDLNTENDETVAMELSNPTNGATVGDANAESTIVDNDLATSYSVDDLNIVEDDAGSHYIRVTRDGNLDRATTIEYQLVAGTADGSDYTVDDGTITFQAGESVALVEVFITTDTAFEDDETFHFELSNPSHSESSEIMDGQGTITIINDDEPAQINVVGSFAEEGNEITFTITRVGNLINTNSVEYAISSNDATAGVDYDDTTLTGLITFNPGETVKTITVSTVNDLLYEGNEQLTLTLSNENSGVVFVNDSATATIIENDAPSTFSMTPDTVVNENGGTVTITVYRSGDLSQAGSVDYAIMDGTAINGDHYDISALTGTVNFAAGVGTQQIVININDNEYFSENKQFDIRLTNPVGATIDSSSEETTVTINNDDPAPVFNVQAANTNFDESSRSFQITITLDGASDETQTVDYQLLFATTNQDDFTSITSGTLSFAPGQTSKVVTFYPSNDSFYEGNERFSVQLSNPQGGAVVGDDDAVFTINDEEDLPSISISDAARVEESGFLVYTIERTGDLSEELTVSYATEAGTATAGEDYVHALGTAVFGVGQRTATIRVQTLSDELAGESDETVNVRIFNPSSDAEISRATATGRIIDNDDDPIISITDVSQNTVEGDGSQVVFTITRTGDIDSALSVDYSTSDISATSGIDYVASSGTLSFAAGETSKQVIINVLNDDAYENTESFRLQLSNVVGSARIVNSQMSANIIEDSSDSPPEIEFESAQLSVNEDENYAVISLVRTDSQAVSTVEYTIVMQTASGEDLVVASGVVTFGASDTRANVQIALRDDLLSEGDETFEVRLANPQDAVLGSVDAVQVTIVDDDPLPEIEAEGVVVNESEGVAYITVRLSEASGQEVTVDYSAANGSALAGSDFSAATGQLIFAPGETVKTIAINLVDDAQIESRENFSVNFSNVSNATLQQESVTVDVLDDDAPVPAIFMSDMTVDEGAGTVTMLVHRSGDLSVESSVAYSTIDDSALAGTHYAAASGRITFAAGSATQEITINITNNNFGSSTNKQFGMQLSDVVGATLEVANAEVTIVEDEPAPELSIGSVTIEEGETALRVPVTLSGASEGTVQVSFSIIMVTASGEDYMLDSGLTRSFNSGISLQNIPFSIPDDDLVEGTETFKVRLDAVISGDATISPEHNEGTVTIIDNDDYPELSVADSHVTEDGGFLVFTIQRTGNLNVESSVDYLISSPIGDGYAQAGVDYDSSNLAGSVVFAAGVSEMTVSLPITNDVSAEVIERLTISIDNAQNAEIRTARATGYILDDDEETVFTVLDQTVNEDDGTVTITVIRSGSDLSAATIDYGIDLAASTATDGLDFDAVSGSLSFADGETEQTFTLNLLSDTLRFEAEETIVVSLSNASSGSIADDLGVVYVYDNDIVATTRGAIVSSDTGFEIDDHDVTIYGTSDYDNDGYKELLLVHGDHSYLHLSQGSRTGYDKDRQDSNAFYETIWGLTINVYSGDDGSNDYNNDGLNDFVFYNKNTDQKHIFFGRNDWSEVTTANGEITQDLWAMILASEEYSVLYEAPGSAEVRLYFASGGSDTANQVRGQDFNGDGVDDFVFEKSNRKYILHANGDTEYQDGDQFDEEAFDFTGEDGFIIDNTQSNYDTTTLRQVGDVNGDGLADYLFHASPSDANSNNSGDALLVLGGQERETDSNGRVRPSDVGIGIGSSTNRSVTNAIGLGDINGDNIDDFFVVFREDNQDNGGDVENYIIYGGDHLADTNQVTLSKTNFDPDYGVYLSTDFRKTTNGYTDGYKIASGDFNGDGLNDVLMYTAYDGMPAFLLYGKEGGYQYSAMNIEDYIASGNGDHGFKIDKLSSRGQRRVPEFKDLDGDGFDDLIMNSGSGADTRVVVMYGGNYTQSVTHSGTKDDDQIVGTGLSDVIVTGDGDDTVFTEGGRDTIKLGQGNDEVVLGSGDFKSLAGGAGFDVMKFDAAVDLDLGDYGTGRISGIEEIDITEGESSLSLNLLDVLELGGFEVFVTGDADDKVNLQGQVGNQAAWQTDGSTIEHPLNGNSYSVYTLGQVTVYVDTDVEVVL